MTPRTKAKTSARRRVLEEPREEEAPRDPLEALREQFGMEGYRLKLERQSDTPPRAWMYVATIEPSEELHEDIRTQYGGGNYRLQVRTPTGYAKGGLFRLSIAGAPKALGQEREPEGHDRLSRLEALVERMLDRPNPDQAIDRVVTTITAIAAAVTPLIAPLLNRQPPAGADVATTLKLVQDAEEKGRRQGEQLGHLLAGAGGGSSDGLAEVARENLPIIVNLVRDNMKRRQNGGAPASAPQAAESGPVALVPPPAAVIPTFAPLAPEYHWLTHLRPFYERLGREAARDRDPTLVADYALSEMDVPTLEAVERAAQRPDFIDTLNFELADIHLRHAQWLQEFLGRIVECSTPEQPKAKTGRKHA